MIGQPRDGAACSLAPWWRCPDGCHADLDGPLDASPQLTRRRDDRRWTDGDCWRDGGRESTGVPWTAAADEDRDRALVIGLT